MNSLGVRLLQFKSPAKINLFLKILHKRQDLYHELASVMQTVDLFDELSFSISKRDSLTCSNPAIPLDQRNLVIKALLLFRKKVTSTPPLSIHLQKNIPHQAGLGGGSSNAATTLWAINELLGRPATIETLQELGAELGSDVPFFLTNGLAYCTGRGEIVREIEKKLPIKNITLVMPKQSMSTPEVYQNVNIKMLMQRNIEQDLQNILEGTPTFYNDLEQAAFTACPELSIFKQSLVQIGFKTVLLSGSGSAFFCLDTEKPVELERHFWNCKVNLTYRDSNKWFNQL